MKSASTLDRTVVRKIGDPVWIFNENRRVYIKGQSGPVWKAHWEQKQILGETSRSWLVGASYEQVKIPKKGEQPFNVCWSEEEIDRRAYVHNNAHRVADVVRRLRDYETLKKIAALADYVEPT